MLTNGYDEPIDRFYRMLHRWGFRLTIENGSLIVSTPRDSDVLSPVLEAEIRKRARHLALLIELERMLNRPLAKHESKELRRLAEELNVELEWKKMDLAPGADWEKSE